MEVGAARVAPEAEGFIQRLSYSTNPNVDFEGQTPFRSKCALETEGSGPTTSISASIRQRPPQLAASGVKCHSTTPGSPLVSPGFAGCLGWPIGVSAGLPACLGRRSPFCTVAVACLHVRHSNVRVSKPFGPWVIPAKLIRIRHFGQIGRGIANRDGRDTSLEKASGMRCTAGLGGSMQHSLSPIEAGYGSVMTATYHLCPVPNIKFGEVKA